MGKRPPEGLGGVGRDQEGPVEVRAWSECIGMAPGGLRGLPKVPRGVERGRKGPRRSVVGREGPPKIREGPPKVRD